MKGATILNAYAKSNFRYGFGNEKERLRRQRGAFQADLLARLKVSDTCRKVWAMDRGTPEQIITALFGLSSDEDKFWGGLVARLRTDAAQIDTQKQRIAELEAKDKTRTRELITWIQIAAGPKDGMMANLAAKAKIEALKRELE